MQIRAKICGSNSKRRHIGIPLFLKGRQVEWHALTTDTWMGHLYGHLGMACGPLQLTFRRESPPIHGTNGPHHRFAVRAAFASGYSELVDRALFPGQALDTLAWIGTCRIPIFINYRLYTQFYPTQFKNYIARS